MTNIDKTIEKELRKRKSPVPANADRIKEGALKLPLEQRVNLRNELTVSIDKELVEMEEKFNAAKQLVK